MSPYRGWEEGGTIGFAKGIAQGLLGAALKPTVGVFDVVSRTTEGIRNSAFGALDVENQGDLSAVARTRIPRGFGRLHALLPYDEQAAAAQYLADKLTAFSRDPRLVVVHHQHLIRAVPSTASFSSLSSSLSSTDLSSQNKRTGKSRPEVASRGRSRSRTSSGDSDRATSTEADAALEGALVVHSVPVTSLVDISAPGDVVLKESKGGNGGKEGQRAVQREEQQVLVEKRSMSSAVGQAMYRDRGFEDYATVPSEAWGMPVGGSYVALIGTERVALAHVASQRGSTHTDFRLMWSCPAACIERLSCDPRGDLILSINSAVTTMGPWNSSSAIILDPVAQDYVVFQSLLEQTIGVKYARLQPLHPVGGLIQRDVFKKYASGLKSFLLAPTRHTFQLFGYVLYEYTIPSSSKTGAVDNEEYLSVTPDQPVIDKAPDDNICRAVGDIFAPTINPFPPNRSRTSHPHPHPHPHSRHSPNSSDSTGVLGSSSGESDRCPEGLLNYVYPLVDIVLVGPFAEDGGRFSISLSKRDGGRMRVLKRQEEGDGRLDEHGKSILTLLFPDQKSALQWRQSIESHIMRRSLRDVLAPSPLLPDLKRKPLTLSALRNTMSGLAHAHVSANLSSSSFSASTQAAFDRNERHSNSILGMLVIPSAGGLATATEALKIEIARTLLNARR